MLQRAIRFLNNRYFLFASAILFLSPFIVFSFWNHLSIDDFFIGINKQKYDFWAIQRHYYNSWSGRYVSILSTSILVFTDILYSHTKLLALYFLSASAMAFFYAFYQVNKYILGHAFNSFSILLLALVLLIFELNIIPEPATQFYWFSGAITYQQPVIFLFLLIGTLAGFFYSQKKVIYLLLSILLIFCLHGYNEMITIIVLLYSSFFAAIYLKKNGASKKGVIVLMVINYAAAALLLFAPGNFVRASSFQASSLFSIAGVSFVKCIILIWFFVKEPVWWIILIVLLCAPDMSDKLRRNKLVRSLQTLTITQLGLIYIVFTWLPYFTILNVSNSSIPYRMENAFCFLQAVMLILIIYIKFPARIRIPHSNYIYKYRFILISVALYCTVNMERIGQTAISGYFYNSVMNDRLAKLKQASTSKTKTLTLDSYEIAIDRTIKSHFPAGTRKTIRDWISEPPALLFFTDDLHNLHLLRSFYKIDSIEINGHLK